MRPDPTFKAVAIVSILAIILSLILSLFCDKSYGQAPGYWEFQMRVNQENWLKRHFQLLNSEDLIWTVLQDTVKGFYRLGSMIRVDTLGTGTAIWFPEMPVVFKEGTGGIVFTRIGRDTLMISFVEPVGEACPSIIAGNALRKVAGGGSTWVAGNALSKAGSTGGCAIVAGNCLRKGS